MSTPTTEKASTGLGANKEKRNETRTVSVETIFGHDGRTTPETTLHLPFSLEQNVRGFARDGKPTIRRRVGARIM